MYSGEHYSLSFLMEPLVSGQLRCCLPSMRYESSLYFVSLLSLPLTSLHG
jgi:hypothetical protein